MRSKLEDFVRENRAAFDDKEPSEKVWKSIEASIPVSRRTAFWNSVQLWRAAAVIFMALSLYLLIPKNQVPVQRDVALKEFTDVEQFYIQQISENTELINDLQKTEGLNGFTNDFKQLEAMYMVLKEEMKNRPSQKVKDALVLNLLVRIDLLNQQLHKIEKEYQQDDKENKKMS